MISSSQGGQSVLDFMKSLPRSSTAALAVVPFIELFSASRTRAKNRATQWREDAQMPHRGRENSSGTRMRVTETMALLRDRADHGLRELLLNNQHIGWKLK